MEHHKPFKEQVSPVVGVQLGVQGILAMRWRIRDLLWEEYFHWKMFFLMHLPGRVGSFVRKKCLGIPKCGKNVFIMHDAWFKMTRNITIGEDVRIHNQTYIDASGGIEIGSHVGISPGVHIYSQNHGIRKDALYYTQPYRLGKVTIEDDCWIGADPY